MPCQQIGLCLVRVQSELVCSINLSHIAYKDKHYIVNYQKFMYICGMKENYTSKNRHKYYLKCLLIFCVKYRRKILDGKFNDNIKSVFQSIADNSDFCHRHLVSKWLCDNGYDVSEYSKNDTELTFF
jgi:hypothetical protein